MQVQPDVRRNAGWKQDKEICGGGVLFDLGSHAIDLIYYLCGPFASVIGKSQIAYPVRKGLNGAEWETNADEAFYMIATLENGAVGTIEASKITVGTNDDLTLQIYGEHGALKFDLMEPNWLYYYHADGADVPLGGFKGFTKIECVGRYPMPGQASSPAPKLRWAGCEGIWAVCLTFCSASTKIRCLLPRLLRRRMCSGLWNKRTAATGRGGNAAI